MRVKEKHNKTNGDKEGKKDDKYIRKREHENRVARELRRRKGI